MNMRFEVKKQALAGRSPPLFAGRFLPLFAVAKAAAVFSVKDGQTNEGIIEVCHKIP